MRPTSVRSTPVSTLKASSRSVSSTALDTPRASSANELTEQWRQRIQQAKEARRPFIPIWLLNLAFAAGQHWVAWDRRQNRVRALRELDPAYADRELVTVDMINQYRMVQLAELEADDDRPQLITTQEGDNAEEITEQLNRAVAYAWDFEWGAEDALKQARMYTVDLGVSAIRMRFDPSKGNVAGHAAYTATGDPVTHPAELASLAATGTLSDGSLPQLRQVKEGRTCWEAYSAFGILAQPGCNNEASFNWEILFRPVPIEELKERYGAAAAGLQEDPDVASAMGLTTSQSVPDARSQSVGTQRLKGHVWVYTCFQRPNLQYPKGAVAVIASNQYKLLDFQDELPYQTPGGEYHSGVVYLHWWRLNDRFYSRSFIEPLKDPQRIINRRETQNLEIIDRAMPRTYVKQGDLPEAPTGAPMEIVELAKNADAPVVDKGTGPGAWMYEDLAHQASNLASASTIAAIKLGENPPGVDTYSQLALLNDNENSKRAIIIRDHRRQIATLVELGISDIKRYWPPQKQILIAGQDDQIDQAVFTKAQIPTFFMAKVATGAPEPRSQGAQLKMLDSIWAAAVQAWVAVQDGPTWVGWYAASLAAGKPLDLPQAKADTQHDLAYLENELMSAGEQPPVMDYDNLTVHLPVHREAEDQARAQGDLPTLLRIIRHIQDHQAVAQQNIMAAAATAQGAGLPTPGGVPGTPGATPGAQPANGSMFANLMPKPREPYPQMVAPDFANIANRQ